MRAENHQEKFKTIREIMQEQYQKFCQLFSEQHRNEAIKLLTEFAQSVVTTTPQNALMQMIQQQIIASDFVRHVAEQPCAHSTVISDKQKILFDRLCELRIPAAEELTVTNNIQPRS